MCFYKRKNICRRTDPREQWPTRSSQKNRHCTATGEHDRALPLLLIRGSQSRRARTDDLSHSMAPLLPRHPCEEYTRGCGSRGILRHCLRSGLHHRRRLSLHWRPVQPAPERTRMRGRRAQAVPAGRRTGLGTRRRRRSRRAHGRRVHEQDQMLMMAAGKRGRWLNPLCHSVAS